MAKTLFLTQDNSDDIELIQAILTDRMGVRFSKSQALSWLLKLGKDKLDGNNRLQSTDGK